MTRCRSGAILTALVVAATLPPLDSTSDARELEGVTAGGFTSDDVKWLGMEPIGHETVATVGDARPFGEIESASRVFNGYLYVEAGGAIHIFDVSDPRDPRIAARLVINRPGPGPDPVGWNYKAGRFSTNGKILVYSGGHPEGYDARNSYDMHQVRSLHVWDVSNPRRPELLSTLRTRHVAAHCVLRCRWLYDRSGAIYDLRDPRNPRLTDGDWTKGLPFHARGEDGDPRASELEEVAPGLIMVASSPMVILDARKDPLRPKVVARSDGGPLTRGDAAWPGFGTSDIALSLGIGDRRMTCEEGQDDRGTLDESGVATWDTSNWKRTGLLTRLDEYHVDKNGTFADGDPPVSGSNEVTWGGCGVQRLDPHPRFDDGGLVVVSAIRHGVKFLRVDNRGNFEEAGWFLPHQNEIIDAVWITDRIAYGLGRPQGIDILRFTGDL